MFFDTRGSVAFIQRILHGCLLAPVGQQRLYRGYCMGVHWHLWVSCFFYREFCMGVCWHLSVSSFYTGFFPWVFVDTSGSVAFKQGILFGCALAPLGQ